MALKTSGPLRPPYFWPVFRRRCCSRGGSGDWFENPEEKEALLRGWPWVTYRRWILNSQPLGGNVLINGEREERRLQDKNRTPEPPQFLLTTRRASWADLCLSSLSTSSWVWAKCERWTQTVLITAGESCKGKGQTHWEERKLNVQTVKGRLWSSLVGTIKDGSAGLFFLFDRMDSDFKLIQGLSSTALLAQPF